MQILFLIAWRNIWRNPRRSLVLISSIAFGLVAYVGMASFGRGFYEQMIESTVKLRGGHLMVQPPGYSDNPQIRSYLDEPNKVEKLLEGIPGIAFAPGVFIQGMISSSESTSGVMINGIVPEKEEKVTVISQSLTSGDYLRDGSNEILVGESLADKLNVRLGEKVVLMSSGLDRNINSGAYRIAGLFETASPTFDKSMVYIPIDDARDLAGYEDQVTAFTILMQQPERLETLRSELNASLPENHETLSWRDRNLLLSLSIELYDYSLVIMLTILFIAIAFSISNAFLMVIYERIQELGIMSANGVPPEKIRRMFYLEAILITAVACVSGMAIAGLIFGILGRVGLDLSDYAAGLGSFGVSAIIYPVIALSDVVLGLSLIFVIIFLSVLHPAIKASRFEVVEAIHFE